MKWYNAIVYALGIAFCIALALFPKTAPAQEVLSGRGIICDTAEQVARIIKADDFQATLVAVNTEKLMRSHGDGFHLPRRDRRDGPHPR